MRLGMPGLYVSEKGSDINAGTAEKPFKTVAHAMAVLDPKIHKCIYVVEIEKKSGLTIMNKITVKKCKECEWKEHRISSLEKDLKMVLEEVEKHKKQIKLKPLNCTCGKVEDLGDKPMWCGRSARDKGLSHCGNPNCIHCNPTSAEVLFMRKGRSRTTKCSCFLCKGGKPDDG